MKKSELRQLIREMLREELSKRPLKEAADEKAVYALLVEPGLRYPVYYFNTFDGALEEAEGVFADYAIEIKTVIQPDVQDEFNPKKLIEVPKDHPAYHKWTKKAGVVK